ncbi:MAG TPA: PQQ-binding-like beta-propeller repeat protein, partial [Planctomycetota bacterium]|nr:PQQ-binding-like beta-propeller repeat protein [Planctomycetota bacterium]
GVGLDKDTGKLVWQNRDAMAKCHASPVLCPADGRPGVVMIGQNLLRIDPTTGETFWKQEEVQRLGTGYMDPIVFGDRVLVLSGSGANRFRFTATSVSLDNKGLFRSNIYGYVGAGDLANPVTWKGCLYAPRLSSSDRSGMFADNPDLSLSRLECFDLETLEKKWSRPGIAGTPVLCDGKLIIQGQWGELRVVEASPEGYVELANARISEPRSGQPVNPFGRASWATPVLLNGRIYCRFFPGDVVCLDVSRDDPDPDPLVGRRRIVGELCTVTGTLGAKPADAPKHVVGLLAEDASLADAQRAPAVYTLCALKHNDNPGHIEKIAGFVDRGGRVSVTGTLMYENRLSVNQIAPVDP